ncbi:hypothetical protein [Pseudomonas sp. UBA4194]|uniref:hypothetical protein n=1 Tax=Pseudomonas sp. UBA4194 TaxID=1947317 RepID=UPI0025EA12DF|nr:hypothetical protein [Pseudomonas sp. UBA4194]
MLDQRLMENTATGHVETVGHLRSLSPMEQLLLARYRQLSDRDQSYLRKLAEALALMGDDDTR